MKFNLSKEIDRNKARARFDFLMDDQSKVELKKIRGKITIKQNAYLHVVFNLWALNYGDTLDEAKTDLKRGYGLTYIKKGKKYLGRTRDMNTKEISTFIDWIRNKASKEGGFYIPTSEEYLTEHFAVDKQIQDAKEFL